MTSHIHGESHMQGLAQTLSTLRSYSQNSCIEDDNSAHTYSRLLDDIDCWIQRFDQLHVEPGMVVGLRADYSLAALSSLFALLSRRAVVALIPRRSRADECLADARAAIFLEINSNGDPDWRTTSHPTTHPLLDRLRAMGDGGIILFTSGSTGRPKAALHSTERFLQKYRRPGRRFRTLAFLLFDHIAGLDTAFYTLVSGGTLILTPRRDPASILGLIESHRVEVLPASPTFLRMLCADRKIRERDSSSLKIITYGSEPMDQTTLSRLNMQFPNAQISQKYGTTETGSPSCVSRGGDSLWLKFTSDRVETKVVDSVLWIRSDSTILGYLNAPSPVDEEGWYCTADLVDVDGEWIRFRGRASEIINVGGEKVCPTEVEHSILQLDFVRDVLVSGEPHVLLGQIVTARVVLGNTDMTRPEAIMQIWQHCRRRLAAHKAPVRIEVTTDSMVSDRQKRERKAPNP